MAAVWLDLEATDLEATLSDDLGTIRVSSIALAAATGCFDSGGRATGGVAVDMLVFWIGEAGRSVDDAPLPELGGTHCAGSN